jgi:hypothetical protein
MVTTALAALACFLVAFEFLAFQLTSGKDPALGASPVATVAQKRPVVINRRVIQTRVVHLPPKQSATGSATSTVSSAAPASSSASAPAAVSAPAAAPAPAPAPAPVVTSTS